MEQEQTLVENRDNRELSANLVRDYLNRVFGWMAVSMLATAGMCVYATGNTALLNWTCQHPFMLFIACIGIILVMTFGARAISGTGLAVLFIAFSLLEGLILGPILCMYTTQSLGLTFACTAGMFGATALYGAMTKHNLSSMGRMLFMALIGLIIAGIANIFWGNGILDLICSAIGVIVFSLYTAYDTNKIVREGNCEDAEFRSKGAIFGALTLYLDFLNLFLYLLRFLGRAND